MNANHEQPRRRRSRLPVFLVVLTLVACATALLLRTPIRSRYWAWRIAHSTDIREQAVYLTALTNAGDAARWGITALLVDERAEIRQLGLVTLQHVRSDWARTRLLAALQDPDEDTRALAALGLATHGDDAVIPALMRMYAGGTEVGATSACLALERLGTPAAVTALAALAEQPASVAARAALIDALEGVGEPACVPILIELLDDRRTVDIPPRAERVSAALLEQLSLSGEVSVETAPQATSSPVNTIADRAAGVLVRITGVGDAFSSTQPADEHAAAIRRWLDWYDTRSQLNP